MKTWTKDQRKQLNVELHGQHISSEILQTSLNSDATMSTPNWSLSSSSHDSNKNNSKGHVHSGNRNMKLRQRPMSCKPKSIPAQRGFWQQRFSSNESLSGTEMTSNQITGNKEKVTAVAWAEKDNQTDERSKDINDYYPNNQHQQKGSLRVFQKRDQKDKFLIDNGVTESIGENQSFHATAFPVRRMTMSLQHQTSVKGKKQLMPTSSQKNNHPQEETTTREQHKCVIPATPAEQTIYDSIDTERLLRLNLSDPELISHLQDELIARHAGESRKYLSTMAPPSSPRVGSPTAQVDSFLSAQKRTNDTDHSAGSHGYNDINANASKINERQVIPSSKNNSNINLFDVSTVPSSSHSSFTDAQYIEERIEKVPESERKDNKCSISGWVPSAEEGTTDNKEPVTDVRVRSVQLLCTHSGRLRHTATLIETYPVTFPTKYPSSEKEGSKNVTMATNKVFVSKSNYRPIRMVYDEKGQCKPQETGIPVTVPHLHRYLSNLQKKHMKLKEERGMSPHGTSSSLPLADGIYKTTKTYEFGPQGPQETVQKTLISKNLPTDRRPKTSDSTSVGNKMVWKSRPQSGPSRFLTNHNINQKSSGTKSLIGEKQTKKKETQNSNKKELQQSKVISKQQNSLDEEEEEEKDSQVSMELQPSQMIPRVHFESKVNNRNLPLNSILKKSSQETISNQLVNSYDPGSKEKTSNLNTFKNIPTYEPPKNIPENCEKQTNKTTMVGQSDLSHFKDTEKLDNTKLYKDSTNNSCESSYDLGPKSQNGIVFNGIGASSDFCPPKDISQKETQKPLKRESSEIVASTNENIDTAVNVLNKSDKDEKKRVSFHPQESDSILSTVSSSDKNDYSFTKEKDKNNSSNLHQEIKNEATTETTEKESDYYLTTTRYIQTDKKETSSNISPVSKDYTNNRRLPGDFSIYRSSTTGLSSQPSLNISVKTEAQPIPTKTKSEKKSPKKGKSTKVKSRSKSNKLTGPPVYLTSVASKKPIDEDDFECEKLSEKLMENGVYVSWKTIRGGLYPPVGRSLHYEIADTGLVPSSDLLSHPKNWFPKEYKELQQARKNLERAELILWKQKRAEEKKFGSKRKKKQTKKKKK